MKRFSLAAWLCVGLALTIGAAAPGSALATAGAPAGHARIGAVRPGERTQATLAAAAAPNYDLVFPRDRVNELTITIAPADWAAMQANMTELFGAPGLPSRGSPTGEGQGAPPAARPPGVGDLTAENPIWIPASIGMNGQVWQYVGVRYKGNSTLLASWRSGSQKLPLKLDFSELADQYPEVKNQTFYGFQQISLGSNSGDPSNLRETIAYELLAEAGLPSARTALYEVTVDHGEGPASLGIYTAVEVIDDTMIPRVFGEGRGNLYKADGPAASLAEGMLDRLQQGFQKETNKKSDWSDLTALYAVLHSPERLSDPAAWRAKLDATFETGGFLTWLALSAEMQHWDTYGVAPHNYYLYRDPRTDKLTWISWDHNLVLGSSAPGGPTPGAVGIDVAPSGADAGLPMNGVEAIEEAPDGAPLPMGRGAGGPTPRRVTLDRQSVDASWPLIRYLLDDPVYYAAYVHAVEQTAASVFVPERLAARYQALGALLMPYAAKQGAQTDLEAAIQGLISTTQEQAQATREFLASPAAVQALAYSGR